jgi:hypothetical protein
VLDRFVSGEDLSRTELSKVWQITTQGGSTSVWRSPIYEELIVTVRTVNSGLPPCKKLRVLAGDYPADSEYFRERKPVDRDAAAANVITTDVLDKKRKALVIFGALHLLRNDPRSIVGHLKDNPRASWFVVVPAGGDGIPAAIASHRATSASPFC